MVTRATVIITLKGTKLRESSKAVLFSISEIRGFPVEPPKSEWFPLSQVSKMSNDPSQEKHKDTLIVSEWILNQKGLLSSPSRPKAYDDPSNAPWSEDEDDDIPY